MTKVWYRLLSCIPENIIKLAMQSIHLYIFFMSDISTEWQKMVSGEIYNACDKYLLDVLASTRIKLWRLNNLSPEEKVESRCIIKSILGSCGENFHFNAPFRCDYGCNIYIGEDFFANFNLTILDEAPVKIGDHAFIGPNVSIYTACHPLDATERNTCVEWAESVIIGNNVWIGGSATICPGVTIGDNVVIGAGAVVTRDVPSDVVVAGNPARIIKTLK